jgi:hypothetical protein
MFILFKGSWKAFFVQLGVLSTLAGAFTLTFGSLWVGAQLTLNPQAVSWLQPHLPKLDLKLAAESYVPLTLDQIRRSLETEELIAGEAIALIAPDASIDAANPPAVLLPVLQRQPNCTADPCEAIVGLRLYQPDAPADRLESVVYHLQRELNIEGPAESLVITPLIEGNPNLAPSNRPLPLTSLQPISGPKPRSGLWFTLVGEHIFGDATVRYGQILHFNPGRLYLGMSEPWSSPTGKLPEWQPFTGGGDPELVIDRTVGLEPHYEIYRIASRHFLLDPTHLEPLSLVDPALELGSYREALLLARSGLWSAAYDRLEPLAQARKQSGQSWPEAAQAQLDLIALHARFIKAQADTSWASPGQATIVALLDGRWSAALQQLEAVNTWPEDIFPAIAGNPVRLWRRVEASLRFLPNDRSAQVWAAIVMAARYDRDRAQQWVTENSSTINPTERATIDRLLKQLEPPSANPLIEASPVDGSASISTDQE